MGRAMSRSSSQVEAPDPRVALVTGATGGIGRAIAHALAATGHHVALGYASNDVDAELLAKELDAGGTTARPVRIDVTDPESVDAAVATIERDLGPVSVLVANAGINRDTLLLRMSEDDWSDVIETDLTGTWRVITRVIPKMVRARWGRIVLVGSVVGSIGSAGQANYAAAKAGLVGLARSTARELASRNITCNVVEPGPIETAMTDRLSDERRADLAAAVPLGRLGTPAEVASVVSLICSPAASYVTGAVVPVDGGLSMGR
jgi:3-oxoacyl-(acyl-carrier-protein) reductase